jgi:hypothetical protein
VRANQNRDTPLPPETPFARNPPGGAVIDYLLAAPAKTPVRLEILDEEGGVVRAFSSDDPPEKIHARRYFTDLYVHPPAPPATAAGHHRFVWDLRYPRPRSQRYDYMISAVAGEDTPIAPRGPLALPGRYTVRLTVDGQRHEQPLLLTMDPRVATAPEALAAQFALQGRLVAAMGESFAALERVRALRKGLAARAKRLETALSAANQTFGTILTALDGADAAPTSIQKNSYARARDDLDRLLAEGVRSRFFGISNPNF